MKLARRLGLFDATMIIAGIVIGSGIFMTTGIMAETLPSSGWILLAWITGGLLTLAGAMTYAELGAAFPEAGGQYVYLREAYGPLYGFLFGWILLLVYMSGGIAALAVAFAEYLEYFFPALPVPLVAVAVILLLSVVNFLGLSPGKLVQNVLTVAKIAVLVLLVVLGLTATGGRGLGEAISFTGGGGLGQMLRGFGVALVAVAWAFDGWNCVTLVAGEIRDPRRNLPRALFLGTVGVVVLYVLVNVVYFHALTVSEMAGEVRVAELAATSLFGPTAAVVVAAAVVVSVAGSLNGSILTGPRATYAMARDGLFFRQAARLHPRFGTPWLAILLQAVWSCLLAVTGTFSQLFTFVMFVAILSWVATAAAVFRLRRTRPDLPRPYRTWGYPVVPLLFIVAAIGILADTLVERPVESLAGLGLTLLGVPVYFAWRRRG